MKTDAKQRKTLTWVSGRADPWFRRPVGTAAINDLRSEDTPFATA